ncbi:probable 2-oxoglutarate-dependent dioxygenase AOP1 isoform X1 [Euphorbia lathyris]|uniref:probable 2-oxoglutarate-dependent dioxygenase AOP1 isoform X1 n=1 Tax=Euphorbia lathyris TaxID=212925 RepID=UPI003313752C
MGSETTHTLPIIDFSSSLLKPGTPEWEKLKSQVRKASETYGCFQALFKNIPQHLQNSMNAAMEDIFSLPIETKKLNVSELPFHGYIGSSSKSLYESIGISYPDNLHNLHSFTNLMWPQGNINFSEIVHWFSKPLSELDEMIRRMIAESFGVEKYLDEHLNSTYNILRLNKYEAPQTSEKKIGLRDHTDKNTTSILYQNQTDGLEVQTKDGEWINVKFSPNSFVVIIGESFNVWMNGRLHSPRHRVMMRGKETRYSAALFSVPKESYIVKAVEELVDDEHPLQFKHFRYLDYLKLRFSEVDLNYERPLEDYFGASSCKD